MTHVLCFYLQASQRSYACMALRLLHAQHCLSMLYVSLTETPTQFAGTAISPSGSDVQVVRSEAVARTSVPPQAVLFDAAADTFALVAAPLRAPAAAAGAAGPADAAAAAEDDGDAVSPPHAAAGALYRSAVARNRQYTPPHGA